MKSERVQSRNVRAIPGIQRSERRVSKRSLQIVPYTWHMSQILRFAVAHVQARKDAENLAGALSCERHIGSNEVRRVELGIAGAPSAYIAPEQRDFDRLRHIDTGILQQRRKVIGCRAQQGVLK